MLEISRIQARRYLLAYHGLLRKRPVATQQRVVDFVRRLGCIQFDPLSIVAKNADLVLQSRFMRYTAAMLERALYEHRTLIDGFDKVASIMPVEDYPFFRRLRDGHRRWIDSSHPELHEVIPEVIRRIEEKGSASWSDVRFDRTIEWPWGKAEIGRAALQAMYHMGELAIHHRVGTKKHYALSASLLPDEILNAPEPNPTEESYIDWRVERRIRSAGLLPNRSSDAWLIDGVKSPERTASIERLVAGNRIVPVRVGGIDPPLYVPAERACDVSRTRRLPSQPQARLIAPLDNLLWDRRLVSELFDFDYRWEVYTPAVKRKYGYYVLPVLYGDTFTARCEPVLHRKESRLELKSWWWEHDAPADTKIAEAVELCLNEFAAFCKAETINYTTDVLDQPTT